MRLPSAVVPLFDYAVDDILAALPPPADPLWNAAQFRQHIFKPHSVTRSIVFNWLDNAWRHGQPFLVLRADRPPSELTAAVASCATALEKRLNGKVAKLMLAELAPGGSVAEHVDAGAALTCVHRCHVPVVSNEDVDFIVDGERFNLKPGIAYEFDNTRKHGVHNRSETPRVHLICDIMPNELIG
jgi:aspartyl/asparaginyl beta-hydroxylase (cupin superfamily)